MNPQAVKLAYDLFQKDGYTGSEEQFTSLINDNPQALELAYNLFSQDGYTGGFDQFSGLMGVGKKKEEALLSTSLEEDVVSLSEEERETALLGGLSDDRTNKKAANIAKAKNLRKTSRLNPDGSESTVLMESAEADGKFIVYPTLFPKDPNNYNRDPKTWMELDSDAAYEEAKKRDEVFFFDTEEEAQRFAEGSWKGATDIPRVGLGLEDFETVPEAMEREAGETAARRKQLADEEKARQEFIEEARRRAAESPILDFEPETKEVAELEAKPTITGIEEEGMRAAADPTLKKKKFEEEFQRQSALMIEEAEREELRKDEEYIKNINADMSKYLGQTPEVALKDLKDTYGKYGFIFEEINDNLIKATAKSGESYTIPLNPAMLASVTMAEDLKAFIDTNAIMPKQSLTQVEKMGMEFFADNDMDYITYRDMQNRYEGNKKRLYIDLPLKKPDDLKAYLVKKGLEEISKEELDWFENMYTDNVKRADANDIYDKLREDNKNIRNILFGKEYEEVRTQFDVKLDEEYEKRKQKFVEFNDQFNKDINQLQNLSMKVLGVGLDEILDFETDNPVLKESRDIITQTVAILLYQQDQMSKLYEIEALPFFNAKYDKQTKGDLIYGMEAWGNAWNTGLARGNAISAILPAVVGMVDLNTLNLTSPELAKEIAGHISDANSGKFSIGDVTNRRAQGQWEYFRSLRNRPFEYIGALVGNSFAQMLPIASKLAPMIAGPTIVKEIAKDAPKLAPLPPQGKVAGTLLSTGKGILKSINNISNATQFAVEYGNAMLETMERLHGDQSNSLNVEKALLDPRVWQEGSERGVRRGLPITLVEYYGNKYAGRIFGQAKYATKAQRVLGDIAETAIVDPMLEGLGEAAAQLVADGEFEVKEIENEMLAALGQKAPNLVANRVLDMTNIKEQKLVKRLKNLNFVLGEDVSGARMSNWVNEQEKKGRITKEDAEIIRNNISARTEAREILNVDEYNKDKPSKDSEVEARLAELIAADKKLGATDALKVAYSELRREITKEIKEISTTRKLREVDQQTDLSVIKKETEAAPTEAAPTEAVPTEAALEEKRADIEKRRQEELNGVVSEELTEEHRRPNGAIGTQGFDPTQMKNLIKFLNEKLGLNIDEKLFEEEGLKPLIDFIKGNKDLVEKIKQYVRTNPIEVLRLPDGTLDFKDGNHRANLLNLIGSDVLPTIDVGQGNKISEINAKYDAELTALKETTEAAPTEAAPIEAAPTEVAPTKAAPKQKLKTKGLKRLTNNLFFSEGKDQAPRDKDNIDRVANVTDRARKAISSIANILPNTNIVLHDSTDSYEAATGKKGRGGFDRNTNTIHINLDKATETTVAHEVFHAVLFNKLGADVELQGSLKQMVTSVAKVVNKRSKLGRYLDKFIKGYEKDVEGMSQESAEAFLNEERLSELMGVLSANYSQLNKPQKNAVIEFIKKVAAKFGIEIGTEFTKTDEAVIDFLNVMSDRISYGEEITDSDMQIFFTEQGTGGLVGTFNFPIKEQVEVTKAPSVKDDPRDYIRELVEDKNMRDFEGQQFISNMYDFTTAGETDLGNGLVANFFGGINYVPYMMSLRGLSIGDETNLAAFQGKDKAEAFIRNVQGSGASLFAPSSGSLDGSWQFQQHIFATLTDLALDNDLITDNKLIDYWTEVYNRSGGGRKEFATFQKNYEKKFNEKIDNLNRFKDNARELVSLLGIQDDMSSSLRKRLNDSLTSLEAFQKAIGVENKPEFFSRFQDPLNVGSDTFDIMGVVKFDPSTLTIRKTTPNDIDHHPSFSWTVEAKIEGIYHPTEFYKSYDITDSYTKYNKGGVSVSRKADAGLKEFIKQNVGGQTGGIVKVTGPIKIPEDTKPKADIREQKDEESGAGRVGKQELLDAYVKEIMTLLGDVAKGRFTERAKMFGARWVANRAMGWTKSNLMLAHLSEQDKQKVINLGYVLDALIEGKMSVDEAIAKYGDGRPTVKEVTKETPVKEVTKETPVKEVTKETPVKEVTEPTVEVVPPETTPVESRAGEFGKFKDEYKKVMARIEQAVAKMKGEGKTKQEMEKRVLSSLKRTKIYKGLDDVLREELIRDAKKKVGVRIKSAPSVAKLFGKIDDVKKITLTEKQLLIKRLKELGQGAKDAARAIKKIRKEVTEAVRELSGQGKITPKQVVAIINKLNSLQEFREDKIAEFVNYMAKVFRKAQYQSILSEAKKMIPKAKTNVRRGKLGMLDGGLFEDLVKLFTIKPNLIPLRVLNKYMSLLEEASKGAVLDIRSRLSVAVSVKEILDAIRMEQELIPELRIRFYNSANLVRNPDKSINFAASINEMLNKDEITQEEADLMRKYKNQIVPKKSRKPKSDEQIKEEMEAYIEAIEELKDILLNSKIDLPTRLERDAAKKLLKLIDADKLRTLELRDLENIIKILSNIDNGYFPHYAQLLLEQLEAMDDVQAPLAVTLAAKILPIEKAIGKIEDFVLELFNSGSNYVERILRRNPNFFIDQVFGEFKGKELMKSLFGKMAEGVSNLKTELSTVAEQIQNAQARVEDSFKRNPKKVMMSKFKQMAYLLQLEYNNNPEHQKSKQVHQARAIIQATMEAIKEGDTIYGSTTKQIEEAVSMFEEILEKFSTDGEIDVDKLFRSFNDAEKASVKIIGKINRGMTEIALFTSSVIRGKRVPTFANYVHHRVLVGSKKNQFKADVDSLESYGKSLNPSTKAKTLIEREGTVEPLLFDPYTSTYRGAKMTLMDFHLTAPIRTVRKVMNLFNEELKGRSLTPLQDSIKRALDEAVKRVIEQTLVDVANITTETDRILNRIARTGYRATLARGVKLVAEGFVNGIAAMLADPVSFTIGLSMSNRGMIEILPRIMRNLNSKQTSTLFSGNTLSGRMVDLSINEEKVRRGRVSPYSQIGNAINLIYNQTIRRAKNFAEKIADTMISSPDKVVNIPMWQGSFVKKFYELTNQKPDFEKIAANDEAYMDRYKQELEEATAFADGNSVTVGASGNVVLNAARLNRELSQGTSKDNFRNFIKTYDNYLTRFMIWEWTNARTGIGLLYHGNMIDKKKGTAILAATVLRVTIYNLLIKRYGNIIAEMLIGEDEEEIKKSFSKALGQAVVTSANDMILGRNFGNIARSFINAGVETFNQSTLDFLREGEYDMYEDAVAYSMLLQDPNDYRTKTVTEMLGKGMAGPYAPLINTIELAYKVYKAEPKKDPAAIERQRKEKMIRLPVEIAGQLGLLPFYADIRKIVLQDIYKDMGKRGGRGGFEEMLRTLRKIDEKAYEETRDMGKEMGLIKSNKKKK